MRGDDIARRNDIYNNYPVNNTQKLATKQYSPNPKKSVYQESLS